MMNRRGSIDEHKCHLCGLVGYKDPYAKAPKTVHSARVQNLLLSNEIPLESEMAQFRDFIATEQADIVDLDHRIAKMCRKLKSLAEKRVQKQRNIVDYKKVVDPLRRLPEDLLREIFLPLAKAEPQSTTSLDPSVMPWRLTHVSTRWRDVATSYPRLWSSIRVVYSKKQQLRAETIQKDILALSTQLARAGQHGLDVLISLQIPVASHNSLLTVLATTSARWTSLSFSTVSSDTTILKPLRSALQRLTTLELSLKDKKTPLTQTECSETTMAENLQFLPALNTLLAPVGEALGCGLPLSQVLSYSCPRSCSASEVMQLLSQMPDLEICTFGEISDREDPEPEPAMDVRLSKLHTLSVPTTSMKHLLDASFPTLGALVIGDDVYPHKVVTIDSLISFVTSTKAAIQKLDITPGYLSKENCLLLLEALPTLVSLNTGITSGLLDLEKLTNTHGLAPSLTHIRLRNRREVNYDLAAGIRLQEKRPQLDFFDGNLMFKPNIEPFLVDPKRRVRLQFGRF
ncbi:hypothetical protein C8J56DRAFT_972855 [Mycena floridula]|nr:hypothetical protein C8J56DRAFT_972855 [Mycena floridula]